MYKRQAPAALLRTAAGAPQCTDAGAPVRTGPAAPQPHQPSDGVAHRERTDAELVAALHRHGGPLSGRQVMRLLGVGTPRATRLVRLAGWAPPEPGMPAPNGTSPVARPLQIVAEPELEASQSEIKNDNTTSSTSGSAP